MKIEKVHIKKFKCLEDVDANLNGKNILLLADNGKGKSSFMQFIQIALGGGNIPSNTEGEGYVIADKNGNNYTLEVKVKDGKSVITVKGPDGNRDRTKGALASLVGAMDFDINEFVSLSESKAGRKQQVEIFKNKFLPKEVRESIEKHERNVQTNYDERTEVNKLIKELEGFINTHPLKNDNLEKIVYTDVQSVFAELKAANEANRKRSQVAEGLQSLTDSRSKAIKEIAELQEKIKALKEEVTRCDNNIAETEKWLEENTEVPTADLEKKMNDASTNNAKFEQAKTLKEKAAVLEQAKKESLALTEKITAEREAIETAIREMDSPVQGLSFDDEQLLYNGVPVSVDSLSTSEIIELGIRLKMAENPDLGVLFIQHGESIGTERLKLIKDISEKAGWQIIMEQVVRGKEQLAIEFMVEPDAATVETNN